MKTCPVCGKLSAPRSTISNTQKTGQIYVLADMQLLWRERYQDMACHIALLPIASREVPNWIAEKIFWFEGEIFWPDGRPFDVGDEDIDQAFNDDQSFRWIRTFRNRADSPLKQRPQERLVPRLRLIALAIQIETLGNQSPCDFESSPGSRP